MRLSFQPLTQRRIDAEPQPPDGIVGGVQVP
jgi:hypothetical protein